MTILSTQARKYETKTFNENFAKKVRTCRLPFPETRSLNALLIIHEENTKKNHKRVVSLYVMVISLDLHKF
jgi:hypothetical protein